MKRLQKLSRELIDFCILLTSKLTKKQFKTWIEIASKVRQEYKQGEISREDFIRIISENVE